MKRIVIGFVLTAGVLVVGARPSHADVTTVNGYCFASPDNRLVPCTSPTPTPDVASIAIDKSLSVGPGFPGPANTTSYAVTVTSQFGCFALQEPTYLYALGSSAAAALNETLPIKRGGSGSSLSVAFDQGNGTNSDGVALVNLEVARDYVGPEGLTLKAIWPSENVERVVNVIPPAPTATAGMGTSTATPASTPTATPSPSPTSEGTPTPTPIPVAPAGPVQVQACVDPPILYGSTLGGDSPVLRGLTSAGADCTADVLYLDGSRPGSFDGSSRTADSRGLVAFPFAEKTTAGGGIARVQCAGTSGAQTTACTGFFIRQSSDSGLTDSDQAALLAEIQGLVSNPATCNNYFGR